MLHSPDYRFKIATREAWLSLLLYAIFFGFWLLAFYFGSGPVEEYNYIFGLPEWFFYSCIAGYVAINVLLALFLRFGFTRIQLDSDPSKGGQPE